MTSLAVSGVHGIATRIQLPPHPIAMLGLDQGTIRADSAQTMQVKRPSFFIKSQTYGAQQQIFLHVLKGLTSEGTQKSQQWTCWEETSDRYY